MGILLSTLVIRKRRTPITEIIDKISSTIGADNDMEFTYSVPFGIPYAELLHVLGIANSSDKAEFHFENGSATLYPLTLKEWQYAGGKPNNPSEGRDIILRKTKIWLTVSTEYVERDSDLGDQDYLPIEINCDVTFDDFQNGRDLGLTKALNAELFD